MFDLSRLIGLLHVFMALETKFPVRLQEQLLDVGAVRIVAGRALTVADRLMDRFALFVRNVVALGAKDFGFFL